MEIIGVTETAVDMLVGMRRDISITLVGLPKREVISCISTAKEGVIELHHHH